MPETTSPIPVDPDASAPGAAADSTSAPVDAARWCLGDDTSTDADELRHRARAALAAASIAGGAVRVDAASEWGEPVARAADDAWLVVEGGHRPNGLRVGIVGTRRIPASEVARIDRHVCAVLEDPRVTLVSGGARGADAIAHDAAARLGRAATIVLAGGLAHAGPKGHRAVWRTLVAAGGCLVTMRPPHEPPMRGAWLRRNALIAAMSDVVCLVAAPDRSGASSTVRHALALGRPVCVMPWAVGQAWAAGSNRWLDDPGVRVWADADAVFDAVGAAPAGAVDAGDEDAALALTPDARALRDAIAEAPLLGMDGAAMRLGWPAPRLQAARLELTLAGWPLGP